MIKESSIQTTIETYLRYLENQNKLVYVKNNSGAVRTKNNRYIRFGKSGSSDFLIFAEGGLTIHLEVKKKGTYQTPNQKEFQKKIELLNHEYRIARSLEEAKEILKSFDIV